MKSKKKIIVLLSVFVIFFMSMSNYPGNNVVSSVSTFAGKWDVSFYNPGGKFLGIETVTISEDGSFSGNSALSIDGITYQTKLSGKLDENGIVLDGKLTNSDQSNIQGTFEGKFGELTGHGTWGNYYINDGTWRADKITKLDKR